MDRIIKKEWQAIKSRDPEKLRYIFGEEVEGELKDSEDQMRTWVH